MIETKYIAAGNNKDGSEWYLYKIILRITVLHVQRLVTREVYLAVSKTRYKVFKTRRGAEAWLKRMGAECLKKKI